MYIPERQQKADKISFVFEIITSQLVALETRFYWEREYLSLAVNMLRNSPKISNTTKTGPSELIFFQSDQKIWQKYYRAYLRNIWHP